VCVEHAGYKVGHIADTVGAGDAFTAALAMGLLNGRSAEEICNHANALASYICSQHGATPAISKDYPLLK
jgi:fructokinase